MQNNLKLNISLLEYQKQVSAIVEKLPELATLSGKTVFITGGTGLIGAGIADVLIEMNEKLKSADSSMSEQRTKEAIQIYILSRNENTARKRFAKVWEKSWFHYISQDVAEKILVREKIDYIIHAASKGNPSSFMRDPVGIMEANIIGTRQVLELAKNQANHDCRMLFISTGEVYGILEHVEKNGIKENDCGKLDPLNPRNCYGISKRAGETLCMAYAEEYDIDVSIARLSHTYGPLETALPDEDRVVFQFLRKAVAGENIILKSAGTQIRSWTYLPDAVYGVLAVLLRGNKKEAYNIANHHSKCSIRELAEAIAATFQVQVEFENPTDAEKKSSSMIEYAVLDDQKLREIAP